MSKRIIRIVKDKDVKSLEGEIAFLHTVISNLTDDKNDLDEQIKNHQANTEQFKQDTATFQSLKEDIQIHKSAIENLNLEITALQQKINSSKKELEYIQNLSQQKESLIQEIEKYTKDVSILQSNMESFHNQYSEKKRKAESTIQNIKSKIIEFQELAKSALSKE